MDVHTQIRHKFVARLQDRNPEAEGTRKMDTVIGVLAVILIAGALVADHKTFIIHLMEKFLP